MYDFFYNIVMKHYPNAKLCYTDTDSFIIEFPDNLTGFTEFLLKNKEHFDLSDCKNMDHPLYQHLDKKKGEMGQEDFEEYINYGVPGKLKSETGWFSIEEFVGLRPKQYSYVTENDKGGMRAKGISMTSTRRYITHQMYVDHVLKDQEAYYCKMSNIQSKNFRIFTQFIYKKGLVNYEDKRYWIDSIYSIPFGHPWIEKIEKGKMGIDEAVERIMKRDKYNYELSAENTLKKKEQEEQREREINESYRQKVFKEGDITITGLTFNQLQKVINGESIKMGVKALASTNSGHGLLNKYLSRIKNK